MMIAKLVIYILINISENYFFWRVPNKKKNNMYSDVISRIKYYYMQMLYSVIVYTAKI